MAAEESSDVGSLRTITTADVLSATTDPSIGYSPTLTSLGGTATNCATATYATNVNACLIDDVLATSGVNAKSGYLNTYGGVVAIGGVNTQYTINGDPPTRGTPGDPRFFTDQTGVIRYGLTSAAPIISTP